MWCGRGGITARGLSPRGRGKPGGKAAGIPPPLGSIPAWAGETFMHMESIPHYSVYPRVGGGNGAAVGQMVSGGGLSPRGRGKPPYAVPRPASARSIPAWAGETPARGMACCAFPVYPRVGGGNPYLRHATARLSGLSPRGRGKPTTALALLAIIRSIPAWAGETKLCLKLKTMPRVYPRVGGGNGLSARYSAHIRGLSPRGRGKQADRCADRKVWGSIPAWAGETTPYSLRSASNTVYPRVGGGNPLCRPARAGYRGLSPRGRGKRISRMPSFTWIRSIPAWAGETGVEVGFILGHGVYPRVGGGNRRSPPLGCRQ